MEREKNFSQAVSAKLGYYVYRLIDPRSGTTFYVGRGQGNRVFEHAAGHETSNTKEIIDSMKLDIIHGIRAAGFEVVHIIHRHGLTEEVAKEVESALIDAYPRLANEVRGYKSDRGPMHAEEVKRRYDPKLARFEHRVILFKIDKRLKENPTIPYIDAVRYQWRISKEKAKKAQYVLAVSKGIIVGVYAPIEWLPAAPTNFPFPYFPTARRGRLGFLAHEAPEDIKVLYLHKQAPPPRRGDKGSFHYEPKDKWKEVDP